MNRFYDSIRAAFLYREPPPRYTKRDNEEKRAVEVCAAPPNPLFEPVERQRHFGILRYTMNKRFNKMMLIGGIILALMVLIIAGVTLLIVFTVSKGGSSSSSTTSITKTVSTAQTTDPYLTKTTAINHPIESSTTTEMNFHSLNPIITNPTTKSSATTEIGHISTTTTYPTTKPSTTTVTRIPDDSCTPFTNTTFLFAYSNDFSPSTVLDSLTSITSNALATTHYSMFASNRFDTVDVDAFFYNSNFSSLNESISNHLPNPSLGYPSSSTGSDVFKMIDRFLNSTQFPICGSILLVLVKRYPSENDIDQLVLKVRKYHASINFIVSEDSSGGLYSEPLYDIASRTNGFCSFVNNDKDVPQAALQSPVVSYPYLIYSANPKVNGQGIIQLPDLLFPDLNSSYWFTMTIQNNGPMNVVEVSLVTMISVTNKYIIGLGANGYFGGHIGNYVLEWLNVPQTFYNVALNFKYKDTVTRALQVRILAPAALNAWMPFDD